MDTTPPFCRFVSKKAEREFAAERRRTERQLIFGRNFQKRLNPTAMACSLEIVLLLALLFSPSSPFAIDTSEEDSREPDSTSDFDSHMSSESSEHRGGVVYSQNGANNGPPSNNRDAQQAGAEWAFGGEGIDRFGIEEPQRPANEAAASVGAAAAGGGVGGGGGAGAAGVGGTAGDVARDSTGELQGGMATDTAGVGGGMTLDYTSHGAVGGAGGADGGANGAAEGANGVAGGANGAAEGAGGAIGGADGAIGGADGAIGGANGAIGGADGAIGGANGAAGGAGGAIGGADGAIGGADGAIGGANGAAGGADGAIGGANGAAGGANGAIGGGANGAIGGANGAIGGANGAAEGANGAIGGANGAIGGANGAIGGAGDAISGANGAIGGANGAAGENGGAAGGANGAADESGGFMAGHGGHFGGAEATADGAMGYGNAGPIVDNFGYGGDGGQTPGSHDGIGGAGAGIDAGHGADGGESLGLFDGLGDAGGGGAGIDSAFHGEGAQGHPHDGSGPHGLEAERAGMMMIVDGQTLTLAEGEDAAGVAEAVSPPSPRLDNAPQTPAAAAVNGSGKPHPYDSLPGIPALLSMEDNGDSKDIGSQHELYQDGIEFKTRPIHTELESSPAPEVGGPGNEAHTPRTGSTGADRDEPSVQPSTAAATLAEEAIEENVGEDTTNHSNIQPTHALTTASKEVDPSEEPEAETEAGSHHHQQQQATSQAAASEQTQQNVPEPHREDAEEEEEVVTFLPAASSMRRTVQQTTSSGK